MTTQTRALAGVIVVGLALLVALWVMAIAPKRSDSAKVTANVAAQQSRLTAATALLGGYTASRKQFTGLLSELREIDKAVPGRGDIAPMLFDLQNRARARGSDLRLVALKAGSGAPTTGTPGATATTPGAVAGPGGLSVLPFTFEYTGKYFDLLEILKTVRNSVRTGGGDLKIGGRLLTIDGLAFNRVDKSKLTKAVVNATAYLAPDSAATPQPPTDAQAQVANGGS
jgi:hypothetical protein